MAAIAPWFCLRLPFCGSGFESQAHHLRFFQFLLLKLYQKITKINKKRPGLTHLKKEVGLTFPWAFYGQKTVLCWRPACCWLRWVSISLIKPNTYVLANRVKNKVYPWNIFQELKILLLPSNCGNDWSLDNLRMTSSFRSSLLCKADEVFSKTVCLKHLLTSFATVLQVRRKETKQLKPSLSFGSPRDGWVSEH